MSTMRSCTDEQTMHHTFQRGYSMALIAMSLFMAQSRAGVLVTLSDAGGGTSNMTILASGIVDPVPAGVDGSYFGYDAPLNSFRASANYDNIPIPSIPTGPGSDPFTILRLMDYGGYDYFQLWTGSLSVPVASPFDLSQMNGTYNVAVDHSLFNVGTYSLSPLFGMNVGNVTLKVVPEVSSALFVGLGLAGVFIVRSRRKR